MCKLSLSYMNVNFILFIHCNHEYLVHITSAQFVTENKVILPSSIVGLLPNDDEVTLPTHFWVKACFQVNTMLEHLVK